MSLDIGNDDMAVRIGELARRLGTSKQEAVRAAVEAKLASLHAEPSLEEKLATFYARNPPREPTAQSADKAFFDELSGE